MKAEIAPRFGLPRISPRGVVVILVLGLVGAMAIEPTRQLVQQRDRIAGVTGDLHAIHESNEALEDQIARLNDDDFIEQRARAQMGLVRPGETSIVVMPPSRQVLQEQRERRRSRKVVEVPAPRSFVESVLHFVGLL